MKEKSDSEMSNWVSLIRLELLVFIPWVIVDIFRNLSWHIISIVFTSLTQLKKGKETKKRLVNGDCSERWDGLMNYKGMKASLYIVVIGVLRGDSNNSIITFVGFWK
jgi:hypothetical protein